MVSAWVFIASILAGGLGALCRHFVGDAVNKRVHLAIPMGTFIVNISACFIDGLVAGLVVHFLAAWSGMTVISYIIGSGFLGGYSTFSTASVEAYKQFALGGATGRNRGLLYAGGMLVTSILFCFAGYFLALI